MQRLVFVRLGTYAMFLACLVLAERRYFIDVDIDPWGSIPRPHHRGGPTPTLVPGFADTRLSGVEIVGLANQRIRSEGIDPKILTWLKISLATRDDRLVWVVTWELIGGFDAGVFDYQVIVDDLTRKTTYEKKRFK
ncbi:MAG: hypothetical protein HY736_19960 [Verrucomicrobia bacterium]|nr:hypothetical protein [Verrucomicrobiota bacterium]